MDSTQYDIDLDFINDCFYKKSLTDSEWKHIEELSGSYSYDIRYHVSELLALFPCVKSEKILLSMLHDEDAMIRASVCDSLSFSRSAQTRDKLVEHLKDKNKLIRGYAALSIGDIQRKLDGIEKTVDVLQSFYRKERSKWCRIAIVRSLLLLGDDYKTDDLLNAINNRYYHIRCFVLKLLIELFEDYGIKIDTTATTSILAKRKKIETSVSVKNSIEKLINLYNKSDG